MCIGGHHSFVCAEIGVNICLKMPRDHAAVVACATPAALRRLSHGEFIDLICSDEDEELNSIRVHRDATKRD